MGTAEAAVVAVWAMEWTLFLCRTGQKGKGVTCRGRGMG